MEKEWLNMNESILKTIKSLLGIPEEDTSFDSDVVTHINSVLFILNQLGIGPDPGFLIRDEHALWEDFLEGSDTYQLEAVKTYIYLKVKLAFDPPSNASLIDALNKQANEYEWRFSIISDK